MTKILLVIAILSNFIPIQTGQIDNLDTFQTFLSLYTAFIMTVDVVLMFALMSLYVDFDMNESNNDTSLFRAYLFVILAPIASISTYVIFGILTPFQIGICVPTIVAIIIYILEFMSKITIDTTNLEKIFFKK